MGVSVSHINIVPKDEHDYKQIEKSIKKADLDLDITGIILQLPLQ